MSLLNFETEWKTTLTSILEELSPPQFRKLTSNLGEIPQGRKTEKHREEFPDIILEFYGTEGSISVMDKEMKVLPRKDAKVQEPLQRFVEELKKRRQEIKEREIGEQSSNPGSSDTVRPSAGAGGGCTGADFVDKHSDELIARVSNIASILDQLFNKKVISQEDYDNILALPYKRDKMRKLLSGPLHSAGPKGKEIFYKILEKEEPFLVDDLKNKK